MSVSAILNIEQMPQYGVDQLNRDALTEWKDSIIKTEC